MGGDTETPMGSLILGGVTETPNGDPDIGVEALGPQWGAQYWGGGAEMPMRIPILGGGTETPMGTPILGGGTRRCLWGP